MDFPFGDLVRWGHVCDNMPNHFFPEMKQEIIDNGDPVEEYILHKDKYPEPKLAYRVDNRYSHTHIYYGYKWGKRFIDLSTCIFK